MIIPTISYFIILAPAISQYNRKFGSHVTTAYDQAIFEGMREQILVIWREMNNTWSQTEMAETYNTWWHVNQNYENSLAANQDYFRSIVDSLTQAIKEKEQIINGNRTLLVPYSQWYRQTLEGFINEIKRKGGLDWVINGAWYIRFQPLTYYFLYWYIPLLVAVGIIGVYLIGSENYLFW